MENELTDFERIPTRPQFLTVLCILTFIGSGLSICSSTFNYFNANFAAKMVHISINDSSNLKRDSLKRKKPPAFVQNILKDVQKSMTPDMIRKDSTGKLFSAICCFLGALMMWKLNKRGYYLYIFGIILGIAIPFTLFGNTPLVIFNTIMSSFIGILFIIFYGMNFKSMK